MTHDASNKERTDRIIKMVMDHLENPNLTMEIYREVDQTLDGLREHQEVLDFHRAIKNICLVHRKEKSDGHNELEGTESSAESEG